MKLNFKSAIVGAMSLAVVGGGLIALAAPAFAATAPPWEPDANAAPAYGNVVFYNALGQEVTGGNNLSHLFDYAAGTTPADASVNNTSVNFNYPQPGSPPNPSLSTWVGPSAGATAADYPITTGAPADIVSMSSTYPVAAFGSSAANLTSALSTASGLSSTAGYANVIQIRLTDSGARGAGNAAGTYWETDIAYNNTGAALPLSFYGITVPANSWMELFPSVTATPVTLAMSPPAASENSGTPVTLTATVPTGLAGTVQFYDGTTALGSPITPTAGSATYPPTGTFTPADGAHSFTAVFIPTAGDETGANTGNAAIVGGPTSPQTATGPFTDASTAVPLTESAPLTATSVSVTATTPITFGTSDDLDATVTPATAGKVQFTVNGANFGAAQTVTVNATNATATLSTTTLPVGTDQISAVFTPTDTAHFSVSPAATNFPVVVSGPAACSLPGSSCGPDAQNVQVEVGAGSITIATPYGPTNALDLGTMQLSTDGTYLEVTGPFVPTTQHTQGIIVTDQLAGDPSWTVAVTATSLVSGSNMIPASGIGLTNGTLLNPTAYNGTLAFTDNPAHNPSAIDTDTNTGLSAASNTFVTATGAANGTAIMNGTLTVLANTSTPAGTYQGTISFSVS